MDAPGKPARIRGRECSKKHALSLPEGFACLPKPLRRRLVQPRPEFIEGKAPAILTRRAYSQYVSAAKWRHLPTRSRFSRHGTAGLPAIALAKAGGFFQHSPLSFQLHGHRSYARLVKSMDDGGPRRGSRHQLNNLQTPPSLFFYFFPTTWLQLTKGLGFSTYFCPFACEQPRL